MTTHQMLLKGREEIAEGTMAFHFQKPAGFSFKAGQTIDLVLVYPPSADAASARHTFSLVSAPFQEVVTIATRMRDSAFKSALRAMPIGAAAKFEGPFGSLTLHTSRARPAIFIAGGIGITPFISILRQAAQDYYSDSRLSQLAPGDGRVGSGHRAFATRAKSPHHRHRLADGLFNCH